MAFDLSTAQPYQEPETPKGGFDLSTAKPVEQQEEKTAMDRLGEKYTERTKRVEESKARRTAESQDVLGKSKIGALVSETPQTLLEGVGQAAGFVGDVAGEGIGAAYRGLVPQAAQNALAGAAQYVAGSRPGQLAGRGINALSSSYGEIPESVRLPVESAVNVVGLGIPATKAAGAGIGATARGVGGVVSPEKLYGSAVKLPLSKKWTRELGAEGVTKRSEAIRAGLESKILPTEVGIQKAKNIELAHRNAVDTIISELDETGQLIPKDRLKEGLKKAIGIAETEGMDVDGIVNRLYNKRFENMGEEVSRLTDGALGDVRVYKPSEIQAIKRHLYSMEDYTKNNIAKSIGTKIRESANKGMAKEAKQSLEELYPQLKNLNKNEAAYINLIEALESAVPRIANRDAVGLGAKVLMTGAHPWLAAIEQVVGLPKVKARLAIALDSARKKNALASGRSVRGGNSLQYMAPAGIIASQNALSGEQ